MTSENKKSPAGLIAGIIGLILLAGVVGLGLAKHLGDAGVESVQKTTGKAKIGGPFTLVNQAGETVTEESLKGKPALIYFGYTYCPDVCPTSLSIMSDALDMIGEELATKVQPVFITVDPKRDSVDVIRDYVGHFYPGMVGLTGSIDQVKKAALAYRVFYQVPATEETEPDTYLVDHSSITYLMDAKGDYLAHFSHGTTAEAMAERLRKYLAP